MFNKKLFLIPILCINVGIFSKLNSIEVNAVKIIEYNLKDSDGKPVDKDSPPAYRIQGSSYFPDNTILYKQEYKDITYYSPKPPIGSQEASGESKQYINWGFWDFLGNQKVYKHGQSGGDRLFESYYYYPQVKILKKTKVTTSDGKDSEDSVFAGYVEAGTVLNVLSITNQTYGTEVFFKLNQIPGLSSGTNVGKVMVTSNNVQFLGTRKNIYFSESANRKSSCRYLTDNFKPYTKPLVLDDVGAHDDLIYTQYSDKAESSKVPNGTVAKGCSIGGRYGEWRFLGLNSTGSPVSNPYFPEDQLSYRGNAALHTYDWRLTPWDATDIEDAHEKKSENGARNFRLEYQAPTTYDLPNFRSQKINALKKLYNEGILVASRDGSVEDFANRVSLLTHPTKETAVFVGQRKGGLWDRSFVLLNTTRDLYIKSIKVFQVGSRTTVAEGSGTWDDFSFKQTKKGTVEKGKKYSIEIVLGNAKDTELIAKTLSAQCGIVKNSPSANDGVAYFSTHEQLGTLSIGEQGGIKAQKGSTSQTFTYPLSIPEDYSGKTIDIYGYVGSVHSSVDNLNYKNDSGHVRVTLDGIPDDDDKDDDDKDKDKDDIINNDADLFAYSIELLDGNSVVYRKTYNGQNSIKRAIVPGKQYTIRYTAKYNGEDRLYYEWVPPVKDNPNTPKNEYKPGYYKPPVVLKYYIPVNFNVTRKVGLTQSDDKTSQNGYFRTSSGETYIPMKKGTIMYYDFKNVRFEHPYLDTSFKITSSDSSINFDRSNDSLSTIIKDTFDISISNVRLLPATEYIDGDEQKFTFNVIYDATLETPNYVSESDYQANSNTSILINGVQVEFKDQLLKGKNTNISHSVSNVPVSPGSTEVTAEVVLNFDKESYESGNYSNNSGSATSKIVSVKDPVSGKPSDTASSTNNSNNNSSPNRGGDANNNCLVPRTKNTWTSIHAIHSWNSTPITYNTFNQNKPVTFYKYNTTQKTSKTTNNVESFEITEVSFRSKDTKDKKLGVDKDGWVKLSLDKEKNLGLIKAGYGFELKIKTEYKTNALLNNPNWSASRTSGTSVTNLSSGVNIIPDIFVELPGDSTTKKILSVSGYKGSIKGLIVKQTKDKVNEQGQHVYSWEYTIKPSSTVGIKEVGKVFIPTNLKNGDYKLSVYTPPVTGVSSLPEYNTSKYSALCDRKDVTITVKGSSTNDLNSHVTQ